MKRLFLQIFAWLAILLGVGLMLQPTVSQYLAARQSSKKDKKFWGGGGAGRPRRNRNHRQRQACPRLPRAVRCPTSLQCADFCRGTKRLEGPLCLRDARL